MYRMLILDDAARSIDGHRKGYAQIDQWYPGTFEITICEHVKRWWPLNDGPYGLKLLKEEKWNIILLDANFDPHSLPDGRLLYDGDGVDVLREIRKTGHLNEKTWLIGCSTDWRRGRYDTPKYMQGTSEREEELKQRLAEFLAHQSEV